MAEEKEEHGMPRASSGWSSNLLNPLLGAESHQQQRGLIRGVGGVNIDGEEEGFEAARMEASESAERLRSECEAGLRRVRYLMAYMALLSAMILPAVGVCEWVLVESRRGNLQRDWWKCLINDNLEIHYIDSDQSEQLPGALAAMLYQSCLLAWAAVVVYQRACIRMDWISSAIVSSLYTLLLICLPVFSAAWPAPTAVQSSLFTMLFYLPRRTLYHQVPEPNKCGVARHFGIVCLVLISLTAVANVAVLMLVCRAESIRRKAVSAERHFFAVEKTTVDSTSYRGQGSRQSCLNDVREETDRASRFTEGADSAAQPFGGDDGAFKHPDEEVSLRRTGTTPGDGDRGEEREEDDEEDAPRTPSPRRNSTPPAHAAERRSWLRPSEQPVVATARPVRDSLKETEGLSHRLCCGNEKLRIPRSIAAGAVMAASYVACGLSRAVIVIVCQRSFDSLTKAVSIPNVDGDDALTLVGGTTLIPRAPSIALGPSAAFLAFSSVVRGYSGDDLANYRIAALLAVAALFVDAPAFAATVHATIQRDLYNLDVGDCVENYVFGDADDVYGYPSRGRAHSVCIALFVNFYATCLHMLALFVMAGAAIRTFYLNHKSFDDVVAPGPAADHPTVRGGSLHLLRTDDQTGFEYDLSAPLLFRTSAYAGALSNGGTPEHNNRASVGRPSANIPPASSYSRRLHSLRERIGRVSNFDQRYSAIIIRPRRSLVHDSPNNDVRARSGSLPDLRAVGAASSARRRPPTTSQGGAHNPE